jgi:aromatic ring-cleaving dioxygenase
MDSGPGTQVLRLGSKHHEPVVPYLLDVSQINVKYFQARDMAQLVEWLPSMHEALGLMAKPVMMA